jgi:hypothetical protein
MNPVDAFSGPEPAQRAPMTEHLLERATKNRCTELRTRIERVDTVLQQWERVREWAGLPNYAPRPPRPSCPPLTRRTLQELRASLLEELTRLEETT